jgi:hypothetical protein
MKEADKFFIYRFIIAFTISLTMILARRGRIWRRLFDEKLGNWRTKP